MSDKIGLNSDAVADHFAVLLRFVGSAVIGVTPEGIISVWNKGAEQLFGYTGEDVVGKPLSILTPSEFVSLETELIDRLRDANFSEDVETRRIHKAGHTIDVSLTYSSVRDNEGRVLGMLLIADSTAEHKRIERAE